MRRLSSYSSVLSAVVQRTAARLSTLLFVRSPAQGLVEYGLILVLIMVVCVAILTTVGHTVSNVWYTKLINRMP